MYSIEYMNNNCSSMYSSLHCWLICYHKFEWFSFEFVLRLCMTLCFQLFDKDHYNSVVQYVHFHDMVVGAYVFLCMLVGPYSFLTKITLPNVVWSANNSRCQCFVVWSFHWEESIRIQLIETTIHQTEQAACETASLDSGTVHYNPLRFLKANNPWCWFTLQETQIQCTDWIRSVYPSKDLTQRQNLRKYSNIILCDHKSNHTILLRSSAHSDLFAKAGFTSEHLESAIPMEFAVCILRGNPWVSAVGVTLSNAQAERYFSQMTLLTKGRRSTMKEEYSTRTNNINDHFILTMWTTSRNS